MFRGPAALSLLIGISVVSVSPMASAAPPRSSQSSPRVTASGAGGILCTALKGSVSFSHPLHRTGTATKTTATLNATVGSCERTGDKDTSISSKDVSGTVKASMTYPNDACTTFLASGFSAATVKWAGTFPTNTIATTVLSIPPSSVSDADTLNTGDDVGLSLAGTTSGSFAGSDGYLYLFGASTRAKLLSVGCSSAQGLSALSVPTGIFAANVAASGPTFTSNTSAAFTEGKYGAAGVAAADNLSTVVTCVGDLPPGLTYEQDPRGFGGTIAGTAIPGSVGTYTVTLFASDKAGLFAKQTVTITVGASTIPYVDSVTPSADGNVGATITIRGANLSAATGVTFGTVDATGVVHVSDTELQVTEPNGSDAGSVDVTVTNSQGTSVTAPGDLFTYELRPHQPVAPSVDPAGLGVYASWTPSPSPDGVTAYGVHATVPNGYTIPSGCTKSRSVSVGADITATVIGGLCARLPYVVTMTATNAFGTTDLKQAAPSIPVVPYGEQPPSQPVITSATPRNGSVIIGIQGPASWGGSPAANARLDLTISGKGSRTVALLATTTTYSAVGLTNGVKYKFSLLAVNPAGKSLAFVTSATPELKIASQPPAGLEVAPDGKGELVISWAPPLDAGTAAVESYVLSYKVVPNLVPQSYNGKVITGKSGTLTLSAKARSVVLPKSLLAIDNYYEVSLVAKTSVGMSRALALPNPVTPDVVMNPDAVELNPTTVSGLRVVPGGVMRWPKGTPSQLSHLRAGDILAAPSSSLFPDGLSVQVESIIKSQSLGLELFTTKVSPADAFLTFSFGLVGTPPSYAAAVKSARPVQTVRHEPAGMLVAPHLSGQAFGSLNLPITFGSCGTPSNPGNCLNTNILVTVGAGAWADWHCVSNFWTVLFCVVSIAVTITSGGAIPPLPTDAGFWVEGGFDVSGSVQLNQSGTLDKPLGTYPLSAIPIPIVGALVFQLSLSMDFSGSIRLYAGYNDAWQGGVQCGYSVGQLSVSCGQPDFLSQLVLGNGVTSATTLDLSASGSATFSARFEANVDTIIGADVEGDLKVSASASSAHDVTSLSACVGVALKAGLDVNLWIFGDYPFNATLWTLNIGCLHVSTQDPVMTVSANGQSPGSCSLPLGTDVQQFTATRSDAASYPPITWSLVNGVTGDGISSSGDVSIGPLGAGRMLTIKAKDAKGLVGELQCTVGTTYLFSPPTNLKVRVATMPVPPFNPSLGHYTASWSAPLNDGGASIAWYIVCFGNTSYASSYATAYACERSFDTNYTFPYDIVPDTGVGQLSVFAVNTNDQSSPWSGMASYGGSLYITGESGSNTGSPPTITVTGANFGSSPIASLAPGCGAGGGQDYSDSALSVTDVHGNGHSWEAGAPDNCVGLSIVSWTPTQVVFTFGSSFGHADWFFQQGDILTITLKGAEYEDATTWN